MGEAKSLVKKELLLSFAIKRLKNSVKKDRPKVAMLGAISPAPNIDGILSTLLEITQKRHSMIIGSPTPNIKLKGSLTISFRFLFEKTKAFRCPPHRRKAKQMRLQAILFSSFV